MRLLITTTMLCMAGIANAGGDHKSCKHGGWCPEPEETSPSTEIDNANWNTNWNGNTNQIESSNKSSSDSQAHSNSDASSTGVGIGVGVGQGGESASSAAAIAAGGQGGEGGEGVATATGGAADQTQGQFQTQGDQTQSQGDQSLVGTQDTNVDAHSRNSNTIGASTGNNTSFVSGVRALSVVLPSATAAPAVELPCIEHLAGWNPLNLGGRTGKTRYNTECMAIQEARAEHMRCMDRVSLYAQLGRVDLAVQQLSVCDGVAVVDEPTEVDWVTQEELHRAFEASIMK